MLSLLVTLGACVHPLPEHSPDAQAIEAVQDAWHTSELERPKADCLKYVEVRRHSMNSSFEKDCAGLNPGMVQGIEKAVGCITHTMAGPLSKSVLLIHLRPGYHDDMGLVQHEALHALYRCAYQHYDNSHADARVWTGASKDPAVRAASVQSRALGAFNSSAVPVTVQ